MPSTVERLSDTRAKLSIEIPFEDLKPAINKAYRELASQITIPGFRKGHIPPGMIDARLGRETVLGEALNAMLPDVYAEAMESHGLTPLSQPQIDMGSLEDGKPVEITVEVDVLPDFDLPDFSTVSVTVYPAENVDEAVDERLTVLRERFAEVNEVDRACKDGDQVKIDLVASRDGKQLDDANAEGLTYVVGSGQMLDGLDEAVKGCKAGDVKTFSSALVGGALEGETADITVTVTSVEERVLPEIDDEFAQMVSQFDSADEMKEDLRKAVERMGLYEQISEARNQVLDEVISATQFEIPEALVVDETQSRLSQINEQLKAAGITMDEFLQRRGDPKVSTPEEFEASTRESVERGIRAEIILSRVVREEQVSVDQQDLTNFVLQKAQDNGTTPDQEIEHMHSHGHLQEWISQIRQSKALDVIATKATVKDTKGKVIDVASILNPPTDAE
ncbi:MAG: trigger factor [Propionibacteriaceae bacterium]|nr:trigger factor [Propionibacteriaceae bacterium]